MNGPRQAHQRGGGGGGSRALQPENLQCRRAAYGRASGFCQTPPAGECYRLQALRGERREKVPEPGETGCGKDHLAGTMWHLSKSQGNRTPTFLSFHPLISCQRLPQAEPREPKGAVCTGPPAGSVHTERWAGRRVLWRRDSGWPGQRPIAGDSMAWLREAVERST